eukprot:Transcript_14076.p3 GENE.Transcript_14076~~Transcript_14076.p3  ORF type:complete len:255 (-),score=109.26 Transcript_14076:1205-1969(-)
MSLAAANGYTKDEVDAVLAVRQALSAAGVPREQLGEVELITITLNAKCRVDEAVTKFNTYRDNLLGEYGISDVWSRESEKVLQGQWHRLAVAGVDEEGRQIMWIHGGGTEVAEEHACLWASCLYFFAVHADLHSLRNGITLVIDTANAPKKKVGNERKLQVAWQNFPTRPQHIYILGTSALTRLAINALIAFASLFAKNKVIARVQFSEVGKVGKSVGTPNLPERHGGLARPETAAWVAQRLAAFPRMGLPEAF